METHRISQKGGKLRRIREITGEGIREISKLPDVDPRVKSRHCPPFPPPPAAPARTEPGHLLSLGRSLTGMLPGISRGKGTGKQS